MDAQIQQIVDRYKEYGKDGWTRKEMVEFGWDCIEIYIPQAKEFADMAGPDKKKWVLDRFEEAYFLVNPDIRWIPEPAETMIEKFAIRKISEEIISPLIDKFYGFMKKRGIL